jgi:MFS family permease
MFALLVRPVFARLFAAQVVALLGTGLMTVALALLAYDLAGERAGAVLGTALAIKMVAYVGLAPLAGALAHRLPRKALLIGADAVRAAVALALPFIDAVWQVYVLIFVLQAASAAFTPAFQALIPDVLPDERDYTRALSLSRLAYDLESLVSPTLAGVLLTVMSFHGLFAGTVLGFAASALLIAATKLPPRANGPPRRFVDRLTRGVRIYVATPRLRGLLALNAAAAAAGAFVIVNTVVVVRAGLGRAEADVALAFAAFGAGSMAAALGLPAALDRLPERPVMIAAAGALAAALLGTGLWVTAAALPAFPALLVLWAGLGALYSTVLVPAGRLLRRSAHAEDRAAVFAAQFALSHACWLVAYPLAGTGGLALGPGATLMILGALAAAGTLAAARLWPPGDPAEIAHGHPDLSPDHPHLRAHGVTGHRHVFVIDDEHRAWPTQG